MPPFSGQTPRTSLLADLLTSLPHLHAQIYFKSSLVALSHAMEDQVLLGHGQPFVFANFQRERYYRQEARRYQRIAQQAAQVYVLAAPETDFMQTVNYPTIPLDLTDPLCQEWHLIVIDQSYAACLICRERLLRERPVDWLDTEVDPARQFEGIWSFDRTTVITAAQLLISKILVYQPHLADPLQAAQALFNSDSHAHGSEGVNPTPFAERLVTYLQAGQYKLQRTYRAIQQQERKERLVNRISTAIRRSLDPGDILQIAVQELGQATQVSRCVVYKCNPDQVQARIEHEYAHPDQASLLDQPWPLLRNPFLLMAMSQGELVESADCATDPRLQSLPMLWQPAQIQAWVAVPVVYQGRLLGILELHRAQPHLWDERILELAEAIALQVGVALIQAEAYQHLEELNQQLAALDQAKNELIAVTGHELRTPLSTIQICLESLVSEPDMPPEMRQEMLDTAMKDAARLRQLVQDFLTLSKLESGRIRWNLETILASECVELALSNVNARRRQEVLPQITVEAEDQLLWVRADGEWLVEVLRKLIDNACKFTPGTGQIWIRILPINRCVVMPVGQERSAGLTTEGIQFTVADNGRGIAAHQLEAIFDRFYQAEGSLRRSVGGTGLGLAICRLIIEGMGGQIWAESAGEGQGSAFHFLLPTALLQPIMLTSGLHKAS